MVKKLLSAVLVAAVLMFSTAAFAGDVVVTKRGKKFHSTSCGLLNGKQTSVMDEQQAVAKGLQPCGKCLKAKEETK